MPIVICPGVCKNLRLLGLCLSGQGGLRGIGVGLRRGVSFSRAKCRRLKKNARNIVGRCLLREESFWTGPLRVQSMTSESIGRCNISSGADGQMMQGNDLYGELDHRQ